VVVAALFTCEKLSPWHWMLV